MGLFGAVWDVMRCDARPLQDMRGVGGGEEGHTVHTVKYTYLGVYIYSTGHSAVRVEGKKEKGEGD